MKQVASVGPAVLLFGAQGHHGVEPVASSPGKMLGSALRANMNLDGEVEGMW